MKKSRRLPYRAPMLANRKTLGDHIVVAIIITIGILGVVYGVELFFEFITQFRGTYR